MAERVEILVVATDAASQVLRGVTSQFGELGNIIQNLTGGRVLETLTSEIIKFGKESIDTTVKYANEVRSLKMISGESAEETSRFIQVLDDYKISSEDAMAATRAMTKEGLVPNIDTLAKLSDQYLSITDKQKQNEFIIKNLGRAGLQWVEVLNLGSVAIREQGEAVSEGLILNDEMLKQARDLEFAQDNLNDTWMETKIRLGTQLVPVLADTLEWFNRFNATIDDESAAWEKWFPPALAVRGVITAIKTAHEEATDTSKQNTQATIDNGLAHEKSKEEIKAEEDAIKALTKANESYLSLVGTLSDNLIDYDRKHEEIQKQLEAGDITLQEAQAEWKKLADEQEKATYRIVLNMLQQRLAIDGLDSTETQFLLQQGVEWGIYSQRAVDEANRVMREVDALESRYNSVPRVVQTDIVTNYITSYVDSRTPVTSSTRRRAGGGDVMAGMLYKVNETREEYFQPSMSGTVIPLGNGKGNNGQGISFVYAPQMSLGSAREAETIIMPFVEQAVRRMQSDGRAGM